MAKRKKGKGRKQGGKQRNIASPRAHAAAPATASPAPAAAVGNGDARRSPAQKRAEHALKTVQGLAGRDYGNYVSYVKALPARIIMNGLGQALAMEKAGAAVKNKKIAKGHELLYAHLENWLLNGWEHSPYRGQSDILAALAAGSEADYIRAQGEAMAWLEWLRKFAMAFLKETETGSETQSEGENAASPA